jgi:predicted GH43/DUF377 family glycosyl hydrolase
MTVITIVFCIAVEFINETKDKIKLTELIGEDARIFKLNGMLYMIYSIHKARFELYYTRLYVNYYGYHPYNSNNHNYKNHNFNDQHHHHHHHQEQQHNIHHHNPQHNHDFHNFNQYSYNYSYSNYSNTNYNYEYNNDYRFKISRSKHNVYVIKDDIYNLKVTKHVNTHLQFHQKNWSPFEFCPLCIYNDDGYIDQDKSYPYSSILLFSYSLQPHRIVKPYKTSISDCSGGGRSSSSSSSSSYFDSSNRSISCGSRNRSFDYHHLFHYDHHYNYSKHDITYNSHDINEDIHNQHFDYNISSSRNNTHDRLDNHNHTYDQHQQKLHIHHNEQHQQQQQQQQQYEYVDTVYTSKIHIDDEWLWGEMRGGTPALYIKSMDGYLAFFHSSGKLTSSFTLTYVMGAYIFNKLPPFHIKYISREPLLHSTMINETLKWAYKAVDYIIFPMSYIIKNDIIYLSYGKNDLSSWILKLDKNKLFQNLKKVRTHSTISMSYYNNNKSTYYDNEEYIYRNTMHRENLNFSSS